MSAGQVLRLHAGGGPRRRRRRRLQPAPFQLLVYPDVSGDWVHVDRWPNTEAKTLAWDTLFRLSRLEGQDALADCTGSIPFLHFALDAQVLFDDSRTDLEKRIKTGDEHPAIEAHLAKYRSLLPSLALLIGLADGETSAICEASLRKALLWMRYLKAHARRIYGAALNPANSGTEPCRSGSNAAIWRTGSPSGTCTDATGPA